MLLSCLVIYALDNYQNQIYPHTIHIYPHYRYLKACVYCRLQRRAPRTPKYFNPLQHQLNTSIALQNKLFKEKNTLYEEYIPVILRKNQPGRKIRNASVYNQISQIDKCSKRRKALS